MTYKVVVKAKATWIFSVSLTEANNMAHALKIALERLDEKKTWPSVIDIGSAKVVIEREDP